MRGRLPAGGKPGLGKLAHRLLCRNASKGPRPIRTAAATLGDMVGGKPDDDLAPRHVGSGKQEGHAAVPEGGGRVQRVQELATLLAGLHHIATGLFLPSTRNPTITWPPRLRRTAR